MESEEILESIAGLLTFHRSAADEYVVCKFEIFGSGFSLMSPCGIRQREIPGSRVMGVQDMQFGQWASGSISLEIFVSREASEAGPHRVTRPSDSQRHRVAPSPFQPFPDEHNPDRQEEEDQTLDHVRCFPVFRAESFRVGLEPERFGWAWCEHGTDLFLLFGYEEAADTLPPGPRRYRNVRRCYGKNARRREGGADHDHGQFIPRRKMIRDRKAIAVRVVIVVVGLVPFEDERVPQPVVHIPST